MRGREGIHMHGGQATCWVQRSTDNCILKGEVCTTERYACKHTVCGATCTLAVVRTIALLNGSKHTAERLVLPAS